MDQRVVAADRCEEPMVVGAYRAASVAHCPESVAAWAHCAVAVAVVAAESLVTKPGAIRVGARQTLPTVRAEAATSFPYRRYTPITGRVCTARIS